MTTEAEPFVKRVWKVDDEAMVFDADAWRKVGHDVGDNSCFWKRARILKVYLSAVGEGMADVLFQDDQRPSLGHFSNSFLEPRKKD